MVVGPQNQTSAPFGSCLHTPISNLHSFPCFHLWLYKSVLQPVFKVILEGKTRIEPLSGFPLREKVNVITTVCRALSDLGPCCPSDPTSRSCPPHCLPSNCRGPFLSFSPLGMLPPPPGLLFFQWMSTCSNPSGLYTNVIDWEAFPNLPL